MGDLLLLPACLKLIWPKPVKLPVTVAQQKSGPTFNKALEQIFGVGVAVESDTGTEILLPTLEELLKEAVTSSPEIPLDIYLDWGQYDFRSPLENWDMVDTNRGFAAFLQTRGYEPVAQEVNDGFGWASWRNRTDQLLAALFPVD